ncbi:GAF domain-containing protein [Williamsia sp. D3]|uniref:GAF domain-containing protein n=1 Tax=Williamsia TaxID=85043 RepID=UPI000DB57776|nr:GAF domain-containing protein [Williamsia sp. D3]PZU02666.1 MAG: hypothetical protein DI630_07265 [Gordonia sp. (in: high G+C Gram-positive bacteria)]
MSWYIIETLERPPTMSVVFRDGSRRDWANVQGLRRDTNVHSETLVKVLEEVRQSGKPVKPIEVPGYQGPRLVSAIPILSYDREVYGIQLWVGGLQEEIPHPRITAATTWDAKTLQVSQGLESWLMSTNDADGFRRNRNSGEFMRKVVRFDGVDELTEHAINPIEGRTLESDVVVLHDEGHLMRWHSVVRNRNDDEAFGLRSIMHDVSDTHDPQVGALEHLGVTEADPNGNVSALIAFPNGNETVVVVKFLTQPPQWIDYRLDGSNDIIHPEDWPLLRRNQNILSAGTPGARVKSQVRIRTSDPEKWVAVNLVEWRYPGTVGDKLHIVQFSRVTPASET